MDRVILVANLKSYKTENEAKQWLESFKNIDKSLLLQKQIIVCPSFTLLSLFSSFIKEFGLDIALGAQNVSPFDEGPYTGEENAKQIKEFAQFVLIGHSERRKNFGETDEDLSRKVKVSREYGLEPIFLVQDKDTLIPEGVGVIAYEPIFAIGSGNPDTPENANSVAGFIKERRDYKILYGGSVKPENIGSFTKESNLSGALIGGASLEADDFIEIIKNA